MSSRRRTNASRGATFVPPPQPARGCAPSGLEPTGSLATGAAPSLARLSLDAKEPKATDNPWDPNDEDFDFNYAFVLAQYTDQQERDAAAAAAGRANWAVLQEAMKARRRTAGRQDSSNSSAGSSRSGVPTNPSTPSTASSSRPDSPDSSDSFTTTGEDQPVSPKALARESGNRMREAMRRSMSSQRSRLTTPSSCQDAQSESDPEAGLEPRGVVRAHPLPGSVMPSLSVDPLNPDFLSVEVVDSLQIAYEEDARPSDSQVPAPPPARGYSVEYPDHALIVQAVPWFTDEELKDKKRIVGWYVYAERLYQEGYGTRMEVILTHNFQNRAAELEAFVRACEEERGQRYERQQADASTSVTRYPPPPPLDLPMLQDPEHTIRVSMDYSTPSVHTPEEMVDLSPYWPDGSPPVLGGRTPTSFVSGLFPSYWFKAVYEQVYTKKAGLQEVYRVVATRANGREEEAEIASLLHRQLNEPPGASMNNPLRPPHLPSDDSSTIWPDDSVSHTGDAPSTPASCASSARSPLPSGWRGGWRHV